MGNSKQDTQEKRARRYRLDLWEEQTGKVRLGFSFTRAGAFLACAVVLVLLTGGLFSLIAFTPVREAIPGYPSAEFRNQAFQNAAKLDSLEEVTALWSIQLTNIQRIVSGRKPLDIDSLYTAVDGEKVDLSEAALSLMAHDDSLLRAEVAAEEMYAISSTGNRVRQIEGMLFFPPVKGIVTEPYNQSIRHPFIDIAVSGNTTVNSALDGTIVSAFWSDDFGYTVIIQHENDIISVYKHNQRLLKKTGDTVKAGTAIAVAGNEGKLSTGPHLHFELWYKGEPLDPALYIKF